MSLVEEWKPVVGFEDRYEVSNLGRVRSFAKMTPLAGFVSDGYRLVCLWTPSAGGSTKRVHRLVCEAFHGPPPNGTGCVDHIDYDRANNRTENLRWVSQAENTARARRLTGAAHPRPRSKLTEADVIEIRRRRAEGESRGEVAKRFGVSIHSITRVTKGHYWRHVARASLDRQGK